MVSLFLVETALYSTDVNHFKVVCKAGSTEVQRWGNEVIMSSNYEKSRMFKELIMIVITF